jgi:hypothetical protein
MLTDKERHVAWTKEAVHSSTFEKARRWDWETSDCSLHAASVRDGRSHGETSRGCELQGSPWSLGPNVYLLVVLRGHCSAWFLLRQLCEVAGPLMRQAGYVRSSSHHGNSDGPQNLRWLCVNHCSARRHVRGQLQTSCTWCYDHTTRSDRADEAG